MDRDKALRAYLVALVLYGTNGIVASYISGLDSTQVVMMRTMLGSLVLIPVFLLLGGRPSFSTHTRACALTALSGVFMGFCWMAMYEAYREIGVGMTSMLYCCGPAILMALTPVIFHERLTWNRVAGMALVLAGAVLLSLNGLGSGGSAWGYFCGVLTPLFYVVLIVLYKKAGPLDGTEAPTLQLLCSFLTVLVFLIIARDVPAGIDRDDLLPVLVLGFINTGVGCLLYFGSIRHLDAQTVAICDYLEPGSAVLFSVIILSEPIDAFRIAGLLLIIAGVLVGEVLGRRRAAVPEASSESNRYSYRRPPGQC